MVRVSFRSDRDALETRLPAADPACAAGNDVRRADRKPAADQGPEWAMDRPAGDFTGHREP